MYNFVPFFTITVIYCIIVALTCFPIITPRTLHGDKNTTELKQVASEHFLIP
jgi:hypothetical protein